MDLTVLEQHIMMAIVGLHANAYGVSIQDHIGRLAGHRPSIGSIYAALDRLEDSGFVKARRGEATAERGGRAKNYFIVTAPGERALKHTLHGLDSLRRGTKEAFA